MPGPVHKVTIRRFLSSNVRQEALRDTIKWAFANIRKNRASLFSQPNKLWTVKAARQEIARHRLVISSDHSGRHARDFVALVLKNLGLNFVDYGPGPTFEGGMDFPVWSAPALEALDQGRATRAILCCGSGTGVNIIANTLGHRSAKATAPQNVVRGREHNDIDVMTIGERMVADHEVKINDLVKSIILFLSTPFIAVPTRYQERIGQAAIIQSLAMAAKDQATAMTETPDFETAVSACPEIADLLVVKAQAAIHDNNYVLADQYVNRYIKLGIKSKNYQNFLESLKALLAAKRSIEFF